MRRSRPRGRVEQRAQRQVRGAHAVVELVVVEPEALDATGAGMGSVAEKEPESSDVLVGTVMPVAFPSGPRMEMVIDEPRMNGPFCTVPVST